MRNPCHQPAQRGEFFRLDEGCLGLLQVEQRRLGRIARGADLAFTALALGDLFGGDVDADDVAVRPALRMPVGDPAALVVVAGALAVDLDAGHGLAGFHDRTNDAFDR